MYGSGLFLILLISSIFNAWQHRILANSKILDINNIKKIPEPYILKRWTIDAKVIHIKRNYENTTHKYNCP